MRTGRWSLVGLFSGLSLAAAHARAQLPPEGGTIETSDYALDLAQNVVLSSARVLGLAGAFVAIAEGADGDSINPAASGVRSAYSFLNADYEVGGGLSLPASLGRTGDYFNSGQKTRITTGNDIYVFLNAQFNLQIDRWGFAATADLQQYSLRRRISNARNPANELTGQIMINHGQIARAFADGQFIVGGGVRAVTLNVTTRRTPVSEGNNIFVTTGLGGEAGFIWRPNDEQVRVGAAFRSTVNAEATPNSGSSIVGGGPEPLYLPERLTLPWDLSFGTAVQLGSRPLNPRWINPADVLRSTRRYLRWRAHERDLRVDAQLRTAQNEGRDVDALERALQAENAAETELDHAALRRIEKRLADDLYERYAAQSRFTVLLTSALVLTGPVEDAVGLESFLNRKVQRSGQQLSLSPRLGVEIEPVPNWVQTRAGFYFEPTRFTKNADGTPSRGRSHGTLGVDVKMFEWDVFGTFPEHNWFRVVGAVDVAREYFNWGLSVGVWH